MIQHYPISKLVIISNYVFVDGILTKSRTGEVPKEASELLYLVLANEITMVDYVLDIETYTLEITTI
jgi:hypothetical protein